MKHAPSRTNRSAGFPVIVCGVILLSTLAIVWFFSPFSNMTRTTYTNDTFGFSLALPEIPKGDFKIIEETYPDLVLPGNIYKNMAITYIRFSVDASDITWPEKRYDLFTITAYPRDWWNEHVVVDNTGNLLIDGLSNGMPSETFAGKNNEYAFTFVSIVPCPIPIESKQNVWQCDVAQHAKEIVLQTFKTL